MAEVMTLSREDGERIAYTVRPGKSPGVVWLGGFKSEMTATKASALDAWAEQTGHAFVRFDYYGHGQSSGEFRNGTITRWRDDALAVLDCLTSGPQILVGSSMGGYLALLVARMRPERCTGLLLVAPAADFTEALLWAGMPKDAKRQILEKGEWLRPSAYDPDPYPIARGLIEDGRRHLLLDKGPIALGCPARILQGMRDPDVPWQHAFKLFRALAGEVSLTLVRDGDHRLSTPSDIARMERTLDALIERTSAR
jgi:pimeloyl-ACP methyl ester carboxylesterase